MSYESVYHRKERELEAIDTPLQRALKYMGACVNARYEIGSLNLAAAYHKLFVDESDPDGEWDEGGDYTPGTIMISRLGRLKWVGDTVIDCDCLKSSNIHFGDCSVTKFESTYDNFEAMRKLLPVERVRQLINKYTEGAEPPIQLGPND